MKETSGVEITAREIFEYSPNGELSAIPEWYLMIVAGREVSDENADTIAPVT